MARSSNKLTCCCVHRHGATISSIAWGKVETNCKLSGTPDCFLTFKNPKAVDDCAFHPCVRLQRWTKDKALSFVPPDGHFTLFEYRCTTTPVIPLSFKATSSLEAGESSLDITLSSRVSSHSFDNLVAEVYLGEGVSGVRCTTGRGGGLGNAQVGNSSLWTWDSRRKVGCFQSRS
jgi:AP-3 complex subunit mu